MDPLFVGLEVAKDHLDVHGCPTRETFVGTQDEAGLSQLGARLQTLGPTLVGLEATGGDEATVAATRASASLPVAVVNPPPDSGLRARHRDARPNRYAGCSGHRPLCRRRPAGREMLGPRPIGGA